MKAKLPIWSTVSAVALLAMPGAAQAQVEGARSAPPQVGTVSTSPTEQVPVADAGELAQGADIVVTGLRQSLERQAEIKRNAPQVVDSIVAEDIGKFPDVTLSAALQRVPGIQTNINQQQEFAGITIRGLGDIITTLQGREVYDNTNRGFNWQTIPAEALARVDVFKSNSADLVEGGVAGAVNINLQRAFNFKEPTVVLSGKATYGVLAEKVNPQVNFLITDRFDTGIGEIGVLLNGTWYRQHIFRPEVVVEFRRSMSQGPGPRAAGIARPNDLRAANDQTGFFDRPSLNGSMQWQASPELQVYIDGLYAGFFSDNETTRNIADLNSATGVRDVVATNDCYTANFGPNGAANQTGFTERVCNLQSATFTNVGVTAFTNGRKSIGALKLGGGGFNYEEGRAKLRGDVAYTWSVFRDESFRVDTREVVPEVFVETKVDGGGRFSTPGYPLADLAGRSFFGNIGEGRSRGESGSWQIRLDGSYELDFFIKEIQAGLRFTDREGSILNVDINCTRTVNCTGGTAANNIAGIPVTAINLPFIQGSEHPRFNDGLPGLFVDPDFLRSDAGRDVLRRFTGRPTGQPAFNPFSFFSLKEESTAAYLQGAYEVPLGNTVTIDGLVGVRVLRYLDGVGAYGSITRTTGGTTTTQRPFQINTRTYSEILPNASARIRFGDGLQARLTYAETVTRPSFYDLNPSVNYTAPAIVTNPDGTTRQVPEAPGLSIGNPNILPQTSKAYDATLEYYFGRGFLAGAVYYRDIRNRTGRTGTLEQIDGFNFFVTRPRNLGQLELYGFEVSGQTFFDFLPGALSGFGVFGNYTYASSEVLKPETDQLFGTFLDNISKHTANAGLLYERGRVSARVSYNYRSRFSNSVQTANPGIRDIENEELFRLFTRPNGRLDASIAYDLTENLRIRLEGSNLTGSDNANYLGASYNTFAYRNDETFISIGARARF